jgi:hypothetical protein
MRRCFSRLQYVLFAALAVLPAMAAANAPCTVGTFQALGLPNTLILVVEALDAGTYPSPSHPAPSPVGTITVPICRVSAVFDRRTIGTAVLGDFFEV